MADYYSSPRISSEFMDCSLPLTFDTDSKCMFKCSYCFASYQKDNNPSLKGKPAVTNPINFNHFEKLMRGKIPDNAYYKNFIRHRFPLHAGGLSDMFSPFSIKDDTSLKVIKLMAELNYPFIISSKGTMMAQGEYLEVFKKAAPNKNFIFQFSIITNNQEKDNILSAGCPSIDERFKAMKILSDLGYWCVLRLRPFIIGASDDGLEELFKKASEHGAKALSTEFYCYDCRVTGKGLKMYDEISKIVGFNIKEYFKKLSPQERGGYMRLNRDVKESYVKRMWKLCKQYNMQFNCSDPDFKELNQSGSCCGIPASKEIYNSDCVNWSRGQLTYMVSELLKRYLAGEKELYLKLEDVQSLV
ncbi:MAG TPA: radical SAM protein, partial [Candidatus Paceibacterota bacterium]|nr:radical SAM protein [Candidatus Paceibacterota bacterium]